MRTEENYSKDRHQRRKRIPFFSLAAALTFSCNLEALSFREELSCSKISTRASRSLTFSDCSQVDFSRAAIFSSCSDWSSDNRRSSPVRRRNSACLATCLARSCQQNAIKTKYLTTQQKYSSTRDTHNKRRMTAQNPLGYSSRLLDWLLHLLL